ncbi:MAG: hypothetical protein V2A54_07220 [Bacteroidota bacterium]
MQKINSETGLRDAILQLERKQADEAKMLNEQLHLAYESIKPINLIKSIFNEAVASRDLKDNLLNTSVGLTAGYLSKILFQGITKSPFKKLLGTALMFGITNVVAKNPEAIKSFGNGFLKMIVSKLGK